LADLRADVAGRWSVLRSHVERRVRDARGQLARSMRELRLVATRTTERRRGRLEAAAGRLHALSPLATLARGYAIAHDEAGRTLSSVRQLTPGLPFRLTLRDGTVAASVRGESPAEGEPP